MGRGRAKAKQQKVARELKYNSQFTDLEALQRELGGGPEPIRHADDSFDDGGNYTDDYEDEDGSWAGASR
jgi:hypothetical protein